MDNLFKHTIDEQGRIIGAVLNMPEDDYFAVKAFSYSGSKQFNKSPAHYQAYLNEPRKLDPSREKYRAAHLLTLEKEQRDRLVIVDGTWSGKIKDEVLALKAQGKIVVKKSAYEEATCIATSIVKHKVAGPIIMQSKCEVSLFWMRDGVYCKCRVDALAFTSEGIWVTDLKNFGELHKDSLIDWQIEDKKYHWQMAFYGEGVRAVFGSNPSKYRWIFVEEDAPHGVKVKNCPDALIEVGATVFTHLPRFKECMDTNEWPGYDEEEDDAGLPAYAFTEVA